MTSAHQKALSTAASRSIRLMCKRAADLLVGSLLLLLLSPVMALIAVAVRLSMGSPVMFRQPRLGYRGEPFTILKFRTMVDSVDHAGRPLPDEERLTVLGRTLRGTTLDELPELINVVRGQMSLVGPRPLRTEYRQLYSPIQWRRHEVRPGMAGPVLAEGRNLLPWDEKFALDVWYVDHWSLGLDVKILLRTAWQVIRREGVSAAGHATMPRFEGSGASAAGRDDRE